jgi:divalent metal cation (Fe/Co/Zn/Cd) transporter
MVEALGSFLVSIVLIFLGVFLMLTAYTRDPILLKVVTLGQLNIHPDSPGRNVRAVIFGTGAFLVFVGVVLIVLDKLSSLGVM